MRQRLLHVLALLFLFAMAWLTFYPVHAQAIQHTQPTVDTGCRSFTFSSDGNPFPLCPGPFPQQGGNCVWWGWEQWHLLGYNLPLNWGNAADWIVDAERFGLPIGTLPRVGSLAVFPVADGVWAFGTAGHVAFVTWVSPDGQNFNVTYQNYGDTTPMYTGTMYNVSYINQPRFQNGQMRFIYFPRPIDPARFAKLPGVGSAGVSGIASANAQLNSAEPNNGALGESRVGLGLPPGSLDQQFSADFTGTGYTDLLLYNRQQGRLDVLSLNYPYAKVSPRVLHNNLLNDPEAELQEPYRVSLHDSKTPVNGWGPNLDIHVGDFTGSGHSEILLYDRVSGQIQILTLTDELTIAKHITLSGWGTGWELYTGQFDGKQSDLLLYKRFAIPTPLPPSPDPSDPGNPAAGGPTGNTPTPGKSGGQGSPTPTPSPSPAVKPNPSPTPSPSPSPTPTPSPTPSPSPSPTPTPTPSPTPTPTPSPSPTPTPTPTPSPAAAPSPTPTPTPSPSPTPAPSSTATPSPSPSATPTSPVGNAGQASVVQADSYHTPAKVNTPKGSGEPADTSGKAPADWNTSGLTAELLLVSLKSDFSVGTTQDYSLWHNTWELSIGRFVSPDRDGLFLYDRVSGEARVVEFSAQLKLAQFQFIHGLSGNWEVHIGDFKGQGQAQILLYDPVSGDAQMLVLNNKLAVVSQLPYTNWGTGMVLYVGHFGLPTLSVMLYNPQQAQSTFLAFDAALNVAHQAVVQTWGPTSQILVGSFLDHALCLEQHTCATGDDILVLNRLTGQVQQYVFSFGNQFGVYDNRIQSFLRQGATSTVHVFPVDSSLFSLLTSEDSTIHNEELY